MAKGNNQRSNKEVKKPKKEKPKTAIVLDSNGKPPMFSAAKKK